MPEDTVTLEFIARRLEAIQIEVRDELKNMRDSITVLTGMAIRVEGAVNGLTMEIAGLRSMVLDHDRRLRLLEGK
jgi:hypothetical protein